jgi:hypothetical protein
MERKTNVQRDHLLRQHPKRSVLPRLYQIQCRAFVCYKHIMRFQTIIITGAIGTYEVITAFSANMRSCSGLRSLFPPSEGRVELCAIFVAAVLNIFVVMY